MFGETRNVKIDGPVQIEGSFGRPMEIKIKENDNKNQLSSEVKIANRSIISLGILGILYGHNIEIGSFLGTKITDPDTLIPGIIFIFLAVEILVSMAYNYRDINKVRINETAEKIEEIDRNLKEIEKYKGQLKETKDPKIKKRVTYMIDKKHNNLKKLKLNFYNQNFLYLGLKISYPLFIGILGLYYLGCDGFMKAGDILIKFNPLVLIILPIIYIISYIFLTKRNPFKEIYKKLKKENLS